MIRDEPWRPLVEGPEADDAWQAVLELAEALRAGAPGAAAAPGLRGPAAQALFFAYLSEARADDADAETAIAFLEAAIGAVDRQPSPPMLYAGFVGVGWVTEHLKGRVIAPDEDDDPDQAIDEYLLEALQRGAAPGDFDLISGLAGLGVYALEALPRPTARRCLELVVECLEGIAVEHGGGLAWFTPPQHLPDYQRATEPDGHFNLGVAHGVPAVVTVLALIGAAGVRPQKCRSLVGKAVRWLLAQRHDGDDWCFSTSVADGATPERARLAWCYGDPGVAATLLVAARAQGRADWAAEALEIARVAARRAPDTGAVKDPALCHGAAGLAHLFNRLYQASGDEEMGRAARFWLGRTLEMRRPGEGIGGFLSWLPDEEGQFRWTPYPAFLTGASGIGLALVGTLSGVEPSWDRVLLCS